MALPLVSSAAFIAALKRLGFEETRRKGSHVILIRVVNGQRRMVVVKDPAREVPRGTLRKSLERAGLSENELRKYLR